MSSVVVVVVVVVEVVPPPRFPAMPPPIPAALHICSFIFVVVGDVGLFFFNLVVVVVVVVRGCRFRFLLEKGGSWSSCAECCGCCASGSEEWCLRERKLLGVEEVGCCCTILMGGPLAGKVGVGVVPSCMPE